MEDKIKTVLFKMIDRQLNGVDVYYHQNNLWFIFTERKEWVFRINKLSGLVYSYFFFKRIFQWLSMDVVVKQDYISEYVENIIQNGIRDAAPLRARPQSSVENIIQNGIRHTDNRTSLSSQIVENIIQNGARKTVRTTSKYFVLIEDAIQNGVRKTISSDCIRPQVIDETLQNGVRKINRIVVEDPTLIEETIKNGTNLKKII
jgi:hypothetical protein